MAQHGHWAAWRAAVAAAGDPDGRVGVVDVAAAAPGGDAALLPAVLLWAAEPPAASYRAGLAARRTPECDPDAPWPLPWETDAQRPPPVWFVEDDSGSVAVALPPGVECSAGGPAVVRCELLPGTPAVLRAVWPIPYPPPRARPAGGRWAVSAGVRLAEPGADERVAALVRAVAGAGVAALWLVGELFVSARPFLAQRPVVAPGAPRVGRGALGGLCRGLETLGELELVLVPGPGDPTGATDPLPGWMLPQDGPVRTASRAGPCEASPCCWVGWAGPAMRAARSTDAGAVAAAANGMLDWGTGLPAAAREVAVLVVAGCDGHAGCDEPCATGRAVAVPRGALWVSPPAL